MGKLKPGLEAERSEIAPGIVLHYTPEGEVTAIDIDSKASKLVGLSSLEVEGLPVDISPAPGKRARRSELAEGRSPRSPVTGGRGPRLEAHAVLSRCCILPRKFSGKRGPASRSAPARGGCW